MSDFGRYVDNIKGAFKQGPKLSKSIVSDVNAVKTGIAGNDADVSNIGDFGNYLDTKYGYFKIGTVDVVRDYNWGITKSTQIKLNEVPTIELVEFQPSNGPILESLLYAVRAGGEAVASTVTSLVNLGDTASIAYQAVIGSGTAPPAEVQRSIKDEAMRPRLEDNRKNAYVDMYTGVSTGNVYSFPFFSTYNHTTSTQWAPHDGIISAVIGETAGKAIKTVGQLASNAYFSIPKRHQFQGVGEVSFETSFQLFNTLSNEDDPKKTILKNYRLIYALLFNNMPDKLSVSTLRPPVIYSLNIPGVRTSPAVYISTIVVENIGQVNKVGLEINGNTIDVNVPDAWNVQLVISELLPESRNIFNGVIDVANKVSVIRDSRGES